MTFSKILKAQADCTCWSGYERVSGTAPCAPGSCERTTKKMSAKKMAPAMSYRKPVVKSEKMEKASGLANSLGTPHCN